MPGEIIFMEWAWKKVKSSCMSTSNTPSFMLPKNISVEYLKDNVFCISLFLEKYLANQFPICDEFSILLCLVYGYAFPCSFVHLFKYHILVHFSKESRISNEGYSTIIYSFHKVSARDLYLRSFWCFSGEIIFNWRSFTSWIIL